MKLLASTVLGLLTTWIIAAACVTQMNYSTMVSGAASATAPTWTFRQWRSFGAVSTNYSPCFNERMIPAYEGPKPHLLESWSRMNSPPRPESFDESSRSYVYFNETGMGWPLVSFISWKNHDGRVRGAGNYVVAEGGAFEWTWRKKRYVFPYSPRWRGLIVGTLIWGTAWYAVIGGPGLVRHWRRNRRGWCLKCGYDLNGSGGVCPECGNEDGRN